MDAARPGSRGEHALQERYATFKRAAAFYDKQMLDYLNPLMREFIASQEMAFIATADEHGECDASFRAGPPGFMRVLDERTLMYPEYRGNGVMASLGNIAGNGHVGILFVDFFRSTVGLHVNGTARIVENDAVSAFAPLLERMAGVDQLHTQVEDKKKTPERWVVVEVVEAYIHCSKHIPLLSKLDKDIDWGTDSEVRKGGDYFKAKHDPRPWVQPVEKPVTACATDAADAAEPVEAQPEPVAEPQPEPVAEAQPEPVAEAQPEPVEVAPVAEQEPEPAEEPQPEPATDAAEPAPVVQSDPVLSAWPSIALDEDEDDVPLPAADSEPVAGDDILDLWVVPSLDAERYS
jgi:uncharacterized protein